VAAPDHGNEAYEKLWRSLLIGKFGQEYDKVNMAWFWARVYKRTTHLGTFAGGFQTFLNLLAERVRQQGAEIHLNTAVERVEQNTDGQLDILIGDQRQTFDAVISTSSPQIMRRLVPDLPADYATKLDSLKSMGLLWSFWRSSTNC